MTRRVDELISEFNLQITIRYCVCSRVDTCVNTVPAKLINTSHLQNCQHRATSVRRYASEWCARVSATFTNSNE